MHSKCYIIVRSFSCLCDYLDVDECKGNHFCHKNAKCTNTIGSHVCECQPGYTGNGQNCTGEFDRYYLTNREALTVILFCQNILNSSIQYWIKPNLLLFLVAIVVQLKFRSCRINLDFHRDCFSLVD